MSRDWIPSVAGRTLQLAMRWAAKIRDLVWDSWPCNRGIQKAMVKKQPRVFDVEMLAQFGEEIRWKGETAGRCAHGYSDVKCLHLPRSMWKVMCCWQGGKARLVKNRTSAYNRPSILHSIYIYIYYIYILEKCHIYVCRYKEIMIRTDVASLLQKLHGHGKHRLTGLHINAKVLIVLLLDMPSLTRKDIWEHFGSGHGKDCNANLDRCCWMSWDCLPMIRRWHIVPRFQVPQSIYIYINLIIYIYIYEYMHDPDICSWTRSRESTKSFMQNPMSFIVSQCGQKWL